MPKYYVKNYFTHGRFPEVGQKQKTEKKKRERAKVGDSNGQATHGTHKSPRPKYGCNAAPDSHCFVLYLFDVDPN